MNKKALLFVSLGTVFAVGVTTVTLSGLNQIQKANEIRATGEYIKTNTEVDITSIYNVQTMAGWEDYYTLEGNGISNKGATVNLQHYDYESYEGSYLYSEDLNSFDYDSDNYMLKISYTNNNHYSPIAYFTIMIHEKAELVKAKSYLLYDESYGSSNKKMEYTSTSVVEGEPGVYYSTYTWSIYLTNTQVGNYITIQRLHIEYLC